jgi:hypothetical protein
MSLCGPKLKEAIVCENSASHDGKYEDDSFLGYSAV